MPDNEPVHGWFGLTYSAYMVLQRSLLQSMPLEWQRKFIALVEEMQDSFDTTEIPSEYTVNARRGRKFVADPFRDYQRGRRRVPRKTP